METGYKLVCINGETDGDEIKIKSQDWQAVTRYLRAALEWNLASATDAITYDPEQPVFVEYNEAMIEMIDKNIFASKWQARSDWIMEEEV
jgi:carboxypeptidase C (cathepsin A)